MDLQNKTAVVTGVSKGIGKATVELLLEEGMQVVGWGRNAPATDHPSFRFMEVDVRKEEAVARAAEQTREAFGEVGVLVNNAGLGINGPVEEMDAQDWQLMFDTNVHGLFYCTKHLVPGMKKKGEGHIINIASIAGTNGVEQMAGYCGTKHAVVGISKSLFKELRNDGVKVTCIMPGSVQTDFFQNIEGAEVHDNMMRPADIAGSVRDLLKTHSNYLPSELEVRPLKPKG